MLSFQQYLFWNTARALGIILGGLALLALLAQGLSWTEIIQENQQSIGVYLKIVWFSAPKILALLVPIAVFVAVCWSLNRTHRDGEIMVVQATGMSNWQLVSPLMRLGLITVIGHLILVLWCQPAAQQAMRHALQDARTDIATALIRPGEFSANGKLTFYARGRTNGALNGLLISDKRDETRQTDYMADRGRFAEIDGVMSLLLEDGRRFQKDVSGEVSILDFERYIFDLTSFIGEGSDIVLEASDRYMTQLIWLDETNYVDAQSHDAFAAEVHNRLTTPLLSLVMIMLGVTAILGGQYSKQGYAKRIALFSSGAVGLVVMHVAAHASAETDPVFNIVQWMIPISAIVALCFHYFKGFSWAASLRSHLRQQNTSVLSPHEGTS